MPKPKASQLTILFTPFDNTTMTKSSLLGLKVDPSSKALTFFQNFLTESMKKDPTSAFREWHKKRWEEQKAKECIVEKDKFIRENFKLQNEGSEDHLKTFHLDLVDPIVPHDHIIYTKGPLTLEVLEKTLEQFVGCQESDTKAKENGIWIPIIPNHNKTIPALLDTYKIFLKKLEAGKLENRDVEVKIDLASGKRKAEYISHKKHLSTDILDNIQLAREYVDENFSNFSHGAWKFLTNLPKNITRPSNPNAKRLGVSNTEIFAYSATFLLLTVVIFYLLNLSLKPQTKKKRNVTPGAAKKKMHKLKKKGNPSFWKQKQKLKKKKHQDIKQNGSEGKKKNSLKKIN